MFKVLQQHRWVKKIKNNSTWEGNNNKTMGESEIEQGTKGRIEVWYQGKKG